MFSRLLRLRAPATAVAPKRRWYQSTPARLIPPETLAGLYPTAPKLGSPTAPRLIQSKHRPSQRQASAEPASSATVPVDKKLIQSKHRPSQHQASAEPASTATVPVAKKKARPAFRTEPASAATVPVAEKKGRPAFRKKAPVDSIEVSALVEPELSAKQEELLHYMLDKKQSVFFTGAAGTGKSAMLRELVRRSPEESTFVTAMTGIASTHLLRGTTLHSFSGMGLANGSKQMCLARAKKNPKAFRNWKNVKLLIIDEASMMSKAFFEKLEYVARSMRQICKVPGADKPFGGVVLCLCGDFFQLPPVCRTEQEVDYPDEKLFCFESDLWGKLLAASTPTGQHCYSLIEIFRQKDDRLLKLLNEVRYGEMSTEGKKTLTMLKRQLVTSEGIEATRLFGTNKQADAVNEAKLAELPDGKHGLQEYKCRDSDDSGELTKKEMHERTTFPPKVKLKVGAQVMLLKNTSPTLVNGSRGIVVDFGKGKDGELLPFVRFLNGEKHLVEREDDKKEMANENLFIRNQVPLKLSWAITIHKSQGMTIDYLEVDLKNIFEVGQAYVALSRARTLDGLRVAAFDARKFWTSPKVVEFYERYVSPL